MKLFRKGLQRNETKAYSGFGSIVQNINSAKWGVRNYSAFADEAYRKNVIANRCINLIATSIAGVELKLSSKELNNDQLLSHPLTRILKKPNNNDNIKEFIERLTAYKLLSGNAYICAVRNGEGRIWELVALRPDRVQIEENARGNRTYIYNSGSKGTSRKFSAQDILHLKSFSPTDEIYGMSSLEAASYAIDQHNQAGAWNQALLQNGAKPSGALVVKASDGGYAELSEEQFERMKAQIEEQFTGSINAGRPLLLEGGLDWKEMSLSPKDMDFIESKNSSARDIALAFGVPPQMLGIPGDNTYSNLIEARMGLWEQTLLPMLDNVVTALNNWLVAEYDINGELGLKISYDADSITALAPRREALWKRINDANFLTDQEKKQMLGL